MSTVTIATAAVLWVSVALRVPTLVAGAAQRSLWIALAGIATAFTLDIPHVVTALHEVVGTNVSHLIKHSVVVIAAGAIREATRALVLTPHSAAEARSRRVFVTIIAVAALAALFAAAPVHDQPLPGFTAAAAGEPVLVAYWTVYLIALAAALVGIVRVTLAAVRTFPAGPLRTGMAWMGVGAVIGLAYCTHKAAFLALAATGTAEPSIEMMERVQSALLTATVALSITGLTWPNARRWPGVRHLLAYRTHRRLEPLWRAYVEAEPAIALEQHIRRRRPLGDIELRLYRRIIEIRDGMLAVQRYGDHQTRERATRYAEQAGHRTPEIVAEAAWLEAARRNKLNGGHPVEDEGQPRIIGGDDLAAETCVLSTISKNLAPINAIADQLEAKWSHLKTMTFTTDTRTPADRAARLLTEAFAPAHLVIGLLLLIGAASHPSPMRGLAWGALAALLVGALPYTWVLHAVRTERLTSRHVPDRRQRLRPLGIAAATALIGLALLYTLGAPRQLVALVIAMLTGLTVTAAITRYWKISLHTAVAAGTATTLTIIYGAMVIVGWAVVSATGWSRIHLREHTLAQVLAGAIVGAVVAVAVFRPLR